MKGFVQIGKIDPVNEVQRQTDMDELMKAMMDLEEQSAFSSGKDDLGIFDRNGKAVDTSELIEQDRAAIAGSHEPEAGVELLAEKILSVYEKQEILNGGVMQVSKLKSLLVTELKGEKVDEKQFASTLELVRSMGMIARFVAMPSGQQLVLFKDMHLDADEIKVLDGAMVVPMDQFTREHAGGILGMAQDVFLGALKSLQAKGIIRFSGQAIHVPGVDQGR